MGDTNAWSRPWRQAKFGGFLGDWPYRRYNASRSRLLPCDMTVEPFRRSEIPAVITPLKASGHVVRNLGAGHE
jgi:hypothetical protein